MNTPHQAEERRLCEAILIDSGLNGTLRGIAPGERVFVDRLIARGDELRVVYEEIYQKLQAHPYAIRCLLASIVRAAVLCSEFGEKTSRNPAMSVERGRDSGSIVHALRSDFGKAMFAVTEMNSRLNGGVLPLGFILSDSAVGALAVILLDCGPIRLPEIRQSLICK